MQLDAEMVEAFSGAYLSPRYDQAQPTPPFHREGWALYCSPAPAVALAAPRSHAKSTGFTHDFALANVVFRTEHYVIIIGASEEMAMGHLTDIAMELRENDDLRRDFMIKDFLQDTKADLIVECTDGHQFRIIARGAEQKIRGVKWRGSRPGLIIIDDLEEDEQVANPDRRMKLKKWILRAVMPALRRGGRVRMHGTIMHKDSFLANTMKDATWVSRCFKAHRSFSDFSDILWPEQFDIVRLKAIRQRYINRGDSAGYSQEYLNDPRDDENAYLNVEQFHEMEERHYEEFMRVCAAADFAISKKDAANRTAIVVGGKTGQHFVNHLDFNAGRWDSDEIIGQLFYTQLRFNPEAIFVEDGVIWKALWPMIKSEMAERDVFINFILMKPIQDKASRGRSFQKRMKGGACRFNKKHSNYAEYEEELLDFSAASDATLDDFFDSTSWLHLGFEMLNVQIDDSQTDEDMEEERMSRRLRSSADNQGRSPTTGY